MTDNTAEFSARRRALWRELLRKPGTLFPLVGLPVPAAVATHMWTGRGVAALIAGVAIVGIILIWRYQQATDRAQDQVMREWGEPHGLAFAGRGDLPPATPLLRAGDKRWGESTVLNLASGLFVSHYTYRKEKGRKNESDDFPFTVCHRRMDANEAFALPRVVLSRRMLPGTSLGNWLRSATSAEEVVELESVEFNRAYTLMVADNHDATAIRRLFTPAFIVWLLDAPGGFTFEMEANSLVVAVPKHVVDTELLDQLFHASERISEHVERTTHQEMILR